jgi:hypothetical protein
MNEKLVSRFVIGTFVVLYGIVSIISTIHVIDFFELSNPYWLAVSLAIAFEFGAAASLASLVALDKMNKTIVWLLFFAITAMQMQGNMYYAYTNLHDYASWIELFNLVEWEPMAQKRMLAFVSGAILPLVALGFIKSLVDYIKPAETQVKLVEDKIEPEVLDQETEAYESMRSEDVVEEEKDWTEKLQDLPEEVVDEILAGEVFIVEDDATEDVFDAPIEEKQEDVDSAYEAGRRMFQESVSSLNKGLKKNESVNKVEPGLINRTEETQRVVKPSANRRPGPGRMGAID